MRLRYVSWVLAASFVAFGFGCSSDSPADPEPGMPADVAGLPGTPVQMVPVVDPTNVPPADPLPVGPAMVDPTIGMAGAGAMDPEPDPIAMDPSAGHELAMDECGLDTGYAGDEYCILPPPADQGFQLHIGPTSYDNPERQYLLEPGVETTNTFTGVSTNDQPVYFYYRQFRMRTGAHHNIITARGTGGLDVGHRIGTSNHLAEDSPVGGIIAPENAGVGILLGANTTISVNLHSINTSEATELREVWINFWYRPAEQVTEPVNEVFATGSVSFAIQPGQDTMLGPFSCDVSGSGRMLWMYGHRHANNVQFTTWRDRGAQRDLIYDANDFEEPLVLEYSSTVTNPVPDIANDIEGGWSGILDLEAGDKITWQCHVINQTDGVLRFSNNTYTGEMCIVDAELVGATCR